jgi:hypothetical protein
MVISRPRQGAGRLRGCPSRLGAPDLGRRHDPHREASARKNAQHEYNHAYGHLRRSAWPLHVGLDRYHGEAPFEPGSGPNLKEEEIVANPGTVLPGNHEVAQRDHGASTIYTKRAFSRDPPAIRSTSWRARLRCSITART